MSERSAPQRVVFVGCGAVAREFYSPALQVLGEEGMVEVAAIMDPDSKRQRELGGFFPTARCLSNFSDVLALKPGLAIVASPPSYHARQVVELLDHGFNVLCEKPMAGTVAECRAMLEAADRSGRLLAIGLFRRFFASTRLVKELVESRALGEPVSVSWVEGGIFDWPAATPSFFQRESSAGGVLMDLGVHVLDLLLHWFGPVESLEYEDDAMGGLEANARLRIEFASGAHGNVRLSRDTPVTNGARVEFERGWVSIDCGRADRARVVLRGSAVALDGLLEESNGAVWPRDVAPCLTYHQSFVEQIRNVCRAIQGQETLRVPGSEGIRSLELIEQCYGNRRLMAMPWLDSKEISTALQTAVPVERISLAAK